VYIIKIKLYPKLKINAYFATVHSAEYKNKCAETTKELWRKPGHKEKVIDSWQNTFNSSDETRNKITANSIKMWADPVKKVEISIKIKESLNTTEMKEWRSDLMIAKWKTDSYSKLWLKQCFTYKDFEMPSGRIVKLQGYEPQILSRLLLDYDENDIIIGKDIEFKIYYKYNGKERRYFPDFYIKSTNTIVEVKSKYTYELHKEKNIAKEDACLIQGFKFIFEIYEK